MLNMPLTELLGIEFPIMQGAMANVSSAALAGAVSEGGGLGIIASSRQDAVYLREQIALIRRMTDKPFGVSIVLTNPHTPAIVDVVVEERVPVLTTGAGTPEPYMDRFMKAGCKVIPVVPHVRAAQKMEAAGAFAVVAEGRESGGHVGPISTMVLVPQVVDAVKIPVIAAGGIADGRGLVATLAFGAVGIQMGTAFLLAKECPVAQAYKDRVLAAKSQDIIVTGYRTKDEVRCLKNELTERYFAWEGKPEKAAELEALLTGSLRRAAEEGDVVNGSIQVGQIAGMLTEEKPARQIMADIVEQAKRIAARFAQ